VFNRLDIIIVSSGSIEYVDVCARGFYFGTVRLGIEFTDENGTVRYMRTEPIFWNNSIDLDIRKKFRIGYRSNVPHQRIILMNIIYND
jgi:hypothetical protein